MRHRFFDLPGPAILGHRGAAGSAPENTLAAFEQGLKLGAHILESDIHSTRDGVPILIHDPSVERVSQGVGEVSDLTLDQLRLLDAGHHFSPDQGDTFPMRGQGLGIPTLEEAFTAFPDARFNLEIKDGRPGLIESVIALVAEYDRADRTLLAAGETQVMHELRAALGRSSIAPATGASLGDIVAIVKAAAEGGPAPAEPMALQIPLEFGGRPLVTEQLLAFTRAADIAVHVWTINDSDEMRRLLDLGVDGIVTDHPERMAEILRTR